MDQRKRNPKRINKRKKTNWAGRRKNNKQRDNQEHVEYEAKPIIMHNDKFDKYYRRILDPLLNSGDATDPQQVEANKQADFEQFVATLREKLPITFRVNPLCVGFETVTSLLGSSSFISDWSEKHKDDPEMQGKEGRIESLSSEELAALRLKVFDFYPERLLFELPVSREVLRKDAVLSAVHKFVQKSNDSGLLTRQEVVSMIPPLLLDVKPGHKVYDA
jgi:16S rRNA C967 or C1407 C5-methylase (RsmB/RsmF family)